MHLHVNLLTFNASLRLWRLAGIWPAITITTRPPRRAPGFCLCYCTDCDNMRQNNLRSHESDLDILQCCHDELGGEDKCKSTTQIFHKTAQERSDSTHTNALERHHCARVSEEERGKRRLRCRGAPCGYSPFAFCTASPHREPVTQAEPLAHLRPLCEPDVWARDVGVTENRGLRFWAAIRTRGLLQPFAAARLPVRLHLRRAKGKMNTRHLCTLN